MKIIKVVKETEKSFLLIKWKEKWRNYGLLIVLSLLTPWNSANRILVLNLNRSQIRKEKMQPIYIL